MSKGKRKGKRSPTKRSKTRAKIGRGANRVVFDRARKPRKATIYRKGKRPVVVVDGVPSRAAPLIDPDTGARIPLLERASVVMHPRPKGLSRGFDVRPAARARRILEMTTGEPVKMRRSKYPWESLTNPVPGVKRDPKSGRFRWPKRFRKNHLFKFRLEFRGQVIVGEALRDDLTRKILGSLGATKLTDVERARLWRGPSGRRAAAQVLDTEVDDIPEDFRERQALLDDEGVKDAGVHLTILE